jgi:hypothetical protein
VLKKLFKVVTTLTLLAGCYFGYVHGFAVVVNLFRASRHGQTVMIAAHDSNSKKQSITNAQASFGSNHWSAADDLGYRYYNAERGFWMYAKDYERIVEENGVRYDGKRIKLRPFALITKSRDGKNTKTITADLAIFDLNEPLGFSANPNGEPLKVNHARLEQNVWVRDDKSTPAVPDDDMRVGPLTVAEYDDLTRQIHTESHVVIQDPDMVTTGDGMVIQLRKDDLPRPPGSSSGFEGAERMDLLRNVHVVVRDVGKTGLMPAAPKGQPTNSKVNASNQSVTKTGSKPEQPPEPGPPTPLDVRSDAKMQVFLPKPVLPVAVGPPAPPAPTIVQFERNVVVLRGQPDDQPDQLTCDTLKLHMIPGEKPSQPVASPPNKRENTTTKSADGDDNGLFGGLTLQRVYATGHVVWLHLPQQGIKLRCNELWHVRRLPYEPDMTYFRGDVTRLLEIEKVDTAYDPDDEFDPGTVTGVTNIWAIDATLFDKGTGTDTANVVAHGPGRLETRPDRGQPIEQIAIWQDKFILQNELGPDNTVLHKIIDLTGNRPCFIDKAQDTQLDSGQLIKVTFKPKTVSTNAAADKSQNKTTNKSDSGLQIERLVAVQDVHLVAPAKTMNAKEQLYAEFFEVDQAPAAATATATATAAAPNTSTPTTTNSELAQTEDAGTPADADASKNEAEKKSADPSMTGTAERIWAKVALKPKPAVDEKAGQPTAGLDSSVAAKAKTAGATKTKSTRKKPGSSDSDAEIRMAWLWGNVSLNQEATEAKTKGQCARGEAIYLDNRGPNKAIFYVYQRDPTEVAYLPGPLPPAFVENETMEVAAAGMIQVNQETDQAWVKGPGTLTQIADRGFFTDKSPEEEEEDVVPTKGQNTKQQAKETSLSSATRTNAKLETRSTSMNVGDRGVAGNSADLADTEQTIAKPKMRAGRPVTEKVPMIISFTNGMEFTGRTVDPEGRPAAQTNFYGLVTAEMEDAKLHAEEKMITYTDKIVPLAQLGAMSKAQSKPKSNDQAGADGNSDSEAEADPQIALIFSYHKAVAISRKVDPDSPQVLQQQRIEADEILAYDRRSGDFFVPGKGVVYLYDRSNDSSKPPGSGAPPARDIADDAKPPQDSARRTVTPTSSRVPVRSQAADSAPRAGTRDPQQLKQDKGAGGRLPPLVLTQIHFTSGMRGRFGTGKESDKTETRWAEFFNNVEALRAKVPDTSTRLNRDKVPLDGFFLTGQTLRVITEPPPVSAPASTPARNYLKAWENAYVFSSDKIVQADVITYDSYKDLIYAYGENGRGVNYAQQFAAGQPTSPGSAKAVQLNPNTGAMHLTNSDTVRMIDKDTGSRPSQALAPDPYAKQKKKIKQPYRLPSSNMERRGFTGQ